MLVECLCAQKGFVHTSLVLAEDDGGLVAGWCPSSRCVRAPCSHSLFYADRSACRLTHWDPGSPPSCVPAILLALSQINLLHHVVFLPDGTQEMGGSAPARRVWASSRCWWSVCVRKKGLCTPA